MKKLTILPLALLCAASVHAASFNKLGFRAYSSGSNIECAVFGSNTLPKDVNPGAIQNFNPDPSLSRTYTLGTRGMANYSSAGLKALSVAWTCRAKGTNEIVNVKVFMDGIETHFLTVGSGTFSPGR